MSRPPKPNRSQPAISRARSARKNPSAAEDIAWQHLRANKLGFRFRREYPILQFRLDFYCPEARLAVEFDGEQHDRVRDDSRDQALKRLGIEVLRIPNREFFLVDRDNMSDPFMRIRRKCQERTGRDGGPMLF